MANLSRINPKTKKWLVASGLFLVLLGALLAAYAWSGDPKFKVYSVGFSTPNVKVWVSDTKLDQRIGILGGSIQGTWEEGGKNNAVFDAPMPHEVYVSWEEDETKIRYEATVKLVGDLGKRARRLPPFHLKDPEVEASWKREDPEGYNKGINLIIGMAPQGKVVIWLSNYPYANSTINRDLQIVGVAQAKIREQSKPYDPYSNKKRQLKE